LEKRLKQATSDTEASTKTANAETAKRLKQLESERDTLQSKLEAANKEAASRKASKSATKSKNVDTQLVSLQAKLQIYEAHAVPYTTEELALLKSPSAQLAAVNDASQKKVNQELPAGSKELLAEAQKAFSTRQLDKAEEKYQELAHQTDHNVYVLANLAAIQLERNKLDEAEKTIKQALEVAPDDGYSLSILGRLKFRQQKYDEAIESLSRAAQTDSQNAEIQNYLGIALSQKGMRGPAETALRKAIQLQPGYGEAHHNLAVAYASQKPPLIELAKWHYQKSLALNSPRSPELEKMLEQKKE
jgi:predicted Zn-dependent protease